MTRALPLLLLAILVGCSSAPAPADDAGSGDRCTTDEDCTDDLYCNGLERCDLDAAGADARGCVAGIDPCAGGECDEAGDRCAMTCGGAADLDEDGDPSPLCGGGDCADDDDQRASTRTEVCDAEGIDEDCDPTTFGMRDQDVDGFVDVDCCNGELCGDDCDDTSASVHRTATEACDTLDNDCDGLVDEGVPPGVYFRDLDGDGAGDATMRVESCTPPRGFVLGDDDCDDLEPRVSPTATEICNGVDDDCDTAIDEMLAGTGADCTVSGATGACATGVRVCDASGVGLRCVPRTAATPETCNGLDDDCDARVDEAVPGIGAACSAPGAVGQCAAGRLRCFGASGAMCLAGEPSPEACSATDEDCDGDPINRGRPPGNFACLDGETRACGTCGASGTERCSSCQWRGTCEVDGRGVPLAWSGADPRFQSDLAGWCPLTPPPGSRCCDVYGDAVGRYCLRGGNITLAPADYELRLFGTSISNALIEVVDTANGAVRAMRRSGASVTGWSERIPFTHPVGSCGAYDIRVRVVEDETGGAPIVISGIELTRLSDVRLR